MFASRSPPHLSSTHRSFHSPPSTKRSTETNYKTAVLSAKMSPYNTFYQLTATEPTQRTVDCENCQKCQHLKRMEELERKCRKYDKGYLNRGEDGRKETERNQTMEKKDRVVGEGGGFNQYQRRRGNNFLNTQRISNRGNRYEQGKASPDGRFIYDYKVDQREGYPIQTFTLYQISPSLSPPPPQNLGIPHSNITNHNFPTASPSIQSKQYQDLIDKIAFVQSTNQDAIGDIIRQILRSERYAELSQARNEELRNIVESLSEKQNRVENKIDGFMSRIEKEKETRLERNVSRQLEEFKEREGNIMREFERMKELNEVKERQIRVEREQRRERQRQRQQNIDIQRRIQRQKLQQLQIIKQKQILSQRYKQNQQQYAFSKQQQHLQQKQTQILIQRQIQKQLQQQKELFKQKQLEWNRNLQQQIQHQKQIEQSKQYQIERQREMIKNREMEKQREWEERRLVQKQREDEMFRQREMEMRNQMGRILELERQRFREQQMMREQEKQMAIQKERELMMQIEKERQMRRRGEYENSSLMELSSEGEDHHSPNVRRRQSHHQQIDPRQPPNPVVGVNTIPFQPQPHPHSHPYPVGPPSTNTQLTQSNPHIKRIYQDVQQWMQVSFQSNNSTQFKQKIASLFSQAEQYNTYLNNYKHSSPYDPSQFQSVNTLVRLKNESVNEGVVYLNKLGNLINSAEQIPDIHSSVRYERFRRQ